MTAQRALAAVGGAAFLAGVFFAAPPALAQSSSCYALWHERNSIYAEKGFCFKTQRAQAVFGEGCFPPFGRLSRAEAQRVRQLQDEEDARGCPR